MDEPKMDVSVNSGKVSFVRGSDGRPASKKTEGNVTVHNEAIEATPPYFDVSFMISASRNDQSGPKNVFHWDVQSPQPELDARHQSYSEVENAAFADLVGQIRGLATALEVQLAEQTANAAKRKDEAK